MRARPLFAMLALGSVACSTWMGATPAAPTKVDVRMADRPTNPVELRKEGSNLEEQRSMPPFKYDSRARLSDAAVYTDLRTLAVQQNPVLGFWDPLDFSSSDFTGCGDAATVGWLRHAEMKHGRVAMAGFVGYIVHENGIRWPWALTNALGDDYSSFEGLSAPALWDAIPEASKYQIIAVIGCLEMWSENSAVLARQGQKHYMMGGKPGFFPDFQGQSLKEIGFKPEDYPFGFEGPQALFPAILHPVPLNLFDPFGVTKRMSDEQKAKKLAIEVNNGRLAMVGLMGFISAATVPGSVPFLDGVVKPYVGEVMQPFASFV